MGRLHASFGDLQLSVGCEPRLCAPIRHQWGRLTLPRATRVCMRYAERVGVAVHVNRAL